MTKLAKPVKKSKFNRERFYQYIEVAIKALAFYDNRGWTSPEDREHYKARIDQAVIVGTRLESDEWEKLTISYPSGLAGSENLEMFKYLRIQTSAIKVWIEDQKYDGNDIGDWLGNQ